MWWLGGVVGLAFSLAPFWADISGVGLPHGWMCSARQGPAPPPATPPRAPGLVGGAAALLIAADGALAVVGEGHPLALAVQRRPAGLQDGLQHRRVNGCGVRCTVELNAGKSDGCPRAESKWSRIRKGEGKGREGGGGVSGGGGGWGTLLNRHAGMVWVHITYSCDDACLEGGDPVMQILELGRALVDRDARVDEDVERLVTVAVVPVEVAVRARKVPTDSTHNGGRALGMSRAWMSHAWG